MPPPALISGCAPGLWMNGCVGSKIRQYPACGKRRWSRSWYSSIEVCRATVRVGHVDDRDHSLAAPAGSWTLIANAQSERNPVTANIISIRIILCIRAEWSDTNIMTCRDRTGRKEKNVDGIEKRSNGTSGHYCRHCRTKVRSWALEAMSDT